MFRIPGPVEGPEASSILVGVVVAVGVQSLLAVGLWLRKAMPAQSTSAEGGD